MRAGSAARYRPSSVAPSTGRRRASSRRPPSGPQPGRSVPCSRSSISAMTAGGIVPDGELRRPGWPQRPHVVRRRPEVRTEAVAPPQVLVGRVDRLRACVELGHPTLGSNVARLPHSPDHPGLTIEVLSPQSKPPHNPHIRVRALLALSGCFSLPFSSQCSEIPRPSEFRQSMLSAERVAVSDIPLRRLARHRDFAWFFQISSSASASRIV